MIVYNDMCYCNSKDCANKECRRHLSHIDFDRMPEWMCYSVSDFWNRCDKYQKKEDGRDENT